MKRLVWAVLVVLTISTTAQARGRGPFWWITPWKQRTRTYQSYTPTTPAEPVEVPESEETELTEHESIQRLHELDGQYRARHGLAPIPIHSLLCKTAQKHAQNMARTGAFDHYLGGSPTYRARQDGWPSACGENISRGYGSLESAYSGLYGSRGHRSNMLSGWNWAGFGLAYSSQGTMYIAVIYSD